MKKRKATSLYVLIGILSINLIFGFSLLSKEKQKSSNDDVETIRVFVDAVSELKKNYVDADKVTYTRLIYAAMRGMMEELDPHSRFHEPMDNKQIKEENEGQFAGIGVMLNVKAKSLEIKQVIPGGPAEEAGIKAGDIIVEIDDKDITKFAMEESRALIRGEEGSSIILGVKRADIKGIVKITVIRGIVMVNSVRRTHVIDNTKIGYIYVEQFIRQTAEDFENAVQELTEKHDIEGLIIDVRANPGGVLVGAVQMCSNFIKKDELVLFTKGRVANSQSKYFSEDGKKFLDLPLVILIDGNSASAAEILSSCLKDYNKAVLVGERTFGKGSVQTIVDLSDGSSLRYTIAKYFTKSKRIIHEVGIPADVEVKLSRKERYSLYENLGKFLPTQKEMKEHDIKDIQLQAGLKIIQELKGRREYKGAIAKGFEANKEEFVKKYSRTKLAKAEANIEAKVEKKEER
ncbi:MAG: S41 family peptidase [Lentisphaeraceae bacterium]|nr:S41 family peptidase [Lentisphaeraceae bacterium]